MNTIIHAIEQGNLDVLEKALLRGWDVDQPIGQSYAAETPLRIAYQKRQYETVKWLVENGVELNDTENPACVTAARFGDAEIFSYLLDKGMVVNLSWSNGVSALYAAASEGKIDLVRLMVQQSVDITKYGGYALWSAAFNGDMEIIELLVQSGADVNYHKREDGITPLMAVLRYAKNNQEKITRFLFDHGADVTIQTDYGERAYHCAKRLGNATIIEWIRANEPKEWHDPKQKQEEYRQKGMPEELISLLTNGPFKLDCPEGQYTYHVTFGDLFDVIEFKHREHELLDLLTDVEAYGGFGVLAWSVRDHCFATYDMEHEWFGLLPDVTLQDILDQPHVIFDGILSGDYYAYEEEDEDE